MAKSEPRTVTVKLPKPNALAPAEYPWLVEWYPDTDSSPWSVTIFDGNPRVDFDGMDEEPNFRLNAGLQISETGEHWPFILLTPDSADMLAGHLLAASAHARAAKAEREKK